MLVIIKKNVNSKNTSNIAGREFRIPCTSFFMEGIEFIVRRGLRTLMTRIADMLLEVITKLIQPITTTTKSSYEELLRICLRYSMDHGDKNMA